MRRTRLDDVPSALTAATFASTGDCIAVALCAAAPPGTLRLHFMSYHPSVEEWFVYQAHRGCILLRFTTSLKFVDVAPYDIWSAGAPEHPFVAPRRNAITTWTLGADRRSWNEAGTVDDDAFYALLIKEESRLPIVRPEFPLVDAGDPRTIYFLMQENLWRSSADRRYGRDAGGEPPAAAAAANFLVAVDMVRKTIVGCLPHMLSENVSSSSTPSYNTVSCNLNDHEPLIPSEFSKYLQ